MGKVLVVDDNVQNCELIEDILRTWGYCVIKAYQGVDAIELAETNLPDIILLDVMLPGMNGFEVCHELKCNETTQNIPIVMLTVLNDLEDRLRGLKVGADTFLSKPINYNELKYIISTFIDRKMTIDNMENYKQLVEVFLTLMQSFDDSLYLRACMTHRYCDRVASLLFFDEQQRTRLSVGAYLQDIGHIVGPSATDHQTIGAQIFSPLKMSKWLNILVQYHHEPANSPCFPRGLAQEKNVLSELEILTTVNRFVDLCADRLDRETAVKVLRKEAQQGCWNKIAVEALNQLIKDEEVMEKLSITN